MKAIIFEQFGEPGEVLKVQEVPMPEPGPGQVRVRMVASPINPSDLLVVRGKSGKLPKLPATPGFEGVGVINAAGPGLLGFIRRLVPGRRVAVLNGAGGNWQEQVIVSAWHVVPLPADISDDQAAGFFVNPASVLAMTQYILKVPPGAWLLQSAAGSTLGQMVIRLGKNLGFKTINVVRRHEQAEAIRKAGGDAVICSTSESIEDKVKALTGGIGVRYALDAVGGETGSALVRSLAPEGRLLVYGTLSGEPISFDPRVLMTGRRSIEGFWLSNWVRDQGVLTMLRLFREITHLLRAGVLTSEIGNSFALEEIQNAVKRADTAGRSGKVLLRMKS